MEMGPRWLVVGGLVGALATPTPHSRNAKRLMHWQLHLPASSCPPLKGIHAALGGPLQHPSHIGEISLLWKLGRHHAWP